ncbi:MAG: hypothetical protein ABDH21_06470 [bacterium]
MMDKLNKINISNFIRNVEISNRYSINNDSEKDIFTLIDDGLIIRDLTPQEEEIIKAEIDRYKNYTLVDLKEIEKSPEERKKLYVFLNAALYNNFYDISQILMNNNRSRFSLTLEIDDDNKLSTRLSIADDIKFTANVKSFKRAIEKMKRKNISSFGQLTDIVRGRIECKSFEQVLKIVDLLKQQLPQQNKEIIEIDNMILNPRDNYMGAVHLLIRDKETGVIFELQLSTQNMLNFFNRKVKVDYGKREVVSDKNIFIDDDQFWSDYHDLVYKALNKLKNDPKYSHLWPEFREIEKEYLEIQREIFEAEKQGIFEQRKDQIEQRLKNLDNLINRTFSKIEKQEIIKSIEG